MLVGDSLDCFEFNNQTVLNKKVGKVFTQDRTIFVANRERMLLNYSHSSLSKAVSQPIFIDFLQMSVPVKAMEREGCFADNVAQGKYSVLGDFRFHISAAKKRKKGGMKTTISTEDFSYVITVHLLAPFCVFCASLWLNPFPASRRSSPRRMRSVCDMSPMNRRRGSGNCLMSVGAAMICSPSANVGF